MTITETITNPPTAVTVGLGTVGTNTFITALPVAINVVVFLYFTALLCYTCYKFYRMVKDKKNAPSE